MQQTQRGRKLKKSQSSKKIRAQTEDIKKKSLNKKTVCVRQFYVGPGNNGKLIANYLSQLQGWKQLDQDISKTNNDFYLKWVQTNSEIQFQLFKEGQQIINHLPNHMILTSKQLIIQTMKEYERSKQQLQFNSSHFFPETYRIDLTSEQLSLEEDQFLKTDNSAIWIIKPTYFNCGRGIKLCSNAKKLKQEFLKLKQISNQIKAQKGFLQNGIFTANLRKCIVQRYIENPLLLEGRKFDIRCYVLIATTRPLFVLFQHGYLRLSVDKYNVEDMDDEKNRYKHLTNAAIQKKHPSFNQSKESTIWSMQQFEQYLKDKKNVTQEKIETLYLQMKKIFAHIIRCSADKFEKRIGTFELMGCDIMIDTNLKVYLIEMNTNPALFLDTTTQAAVIPPVINQTLDLVIYLNEERNKPIEKNLQNYSKLKLGNWEVIHNEVINFNLVTQSN
ncbi:unnamed protein product [Paramecium pentaurelia]|uniref:Tubulin-tyrosine ligase family protein n=1 Tax=Paramecium pentaurelia TaxID=43138 RepID=A0A8S1V4G9_9CILI|nr:unnamed protein product [Paramecium pentaurelia]